MGEKFHGSLDFIIMQGKLLQFAFDKNENNFAYILTLKMALVKLVGKTFMVCRKCMKTVKVFCIGLLFTVYLASYVCMLTNRFEN